jgi:phage shock protein E
MKLIVPILGVVLAFIVFKFFTGGALMADKQAVGDKIKNGALVVDVRSVGEFSGGHFNGALNIPVDEVQKRISEFGANKDREIILYCRSGGRAGSAKQMLEAAGFKKVTNAGGLTDMP